MSFAIFHHLLSVVKVLGFLLRIGLWKAALPAFLTGKAHKWKVNCARARQPPRSSDPCRRGNPGVLSLIKNFFLD